MRNAGQLLNHCVELRYKLACQGLREAQGLVRVGGLHCGVRGAGMALQISACADLYEPCNSINDDYVGRVLWRQFAE